MDTYEVSNRQFKAFVDAGGYTKREYWKHPFVKDGREMSWQEAMEEFRDATRRPGPAGWQLGTYPEGADDLPVGGVSWYEAAAYAEFAGKSLPTVYEWFAAADGAGGISDILPLSNFGGRGPAPVGSHRGMARFGSYDMAGNLKEWVANPRDDRRYVLGGSWDEPEYVFSRFDAKPPLSRELTVGFRLVRRVTPPPAETFGPVSFRPRTDAVRSQPVDDQAFRDLPAPPRLRQDRARPEGGTRRPSCRTGAGKPSHSGRPTAPNGSSRICFCRTTRRRLIRSWRSSATPASWR